MLQTQRCKARLHVCCSAEAQLQVRRTEQSKRKKALKRA